MSLTETLEPTRERIAKGNFERPSHDLKTARVAYKALSIFDTLYEAGKLTSDERDAYQRLERHYRGSLGVRVDNGYAGEGYSDDYQPAQTVHASELAYLATVVACQLTWRALIDTVEERATPAEIGQRVMRMGNRPQAYIAGLTVIKLGLRKIAHSRPRSRERP